MIQRMDNVLIVVEDLEAAKAFFAELGMELEGETTVEGPWVECQGSTGRRRSEPSRKARRRTRWACAASCSWSTTSTTS